MQVHNLVDLVTHLRTLADWKHQGLVRYVGITHYTASAHADVVRVMQTHGIDFVQVNYSRSERAAQDRVLPAALEHGIAVFVNRPFAEGALVGPVPDRATRDRLARAFEG
jgi:aryl-alcohol dehydrogenase-like predicted oxidoreductase